MSNYGNLEYAGREKTKEKSDKSIQEQLKACSVRRMEFEWGEGKAGKSLQEERYILRDKLLLKHIEKWTVEVRKFCEIHINRFCNEGPDGVLVYQDMFSSYYREGADLRAMLVMSGFASRHPRTAMCKFAQIQQAIRDLWCNSMVNNTEEILVKEKTMTWNGYLQSYRIGGS